MATRPGLPYPKAEQGRSFVYGQVAAEKLSRSHFLEVPKMGFRAEISSHLWLCTPAGLLASCGITFPPKVAVILSYPHVSERPSSKFPKTDFRSVFSPLLLSSTRSVHKITGLDYLLILRSLKLRGSLRCRGSLLDSACHPGSLCKLNALIMH